MLQNRTYIGQVRYQRYHKQLDGSRDLSTPTEWFRGQHQPLVPIELFERCQEVRRQRRQYPRTISNCLVYPLSGLLYCKYCGKRLRAQKSPTGKRYYHCPNPIGDLCTKHLVSADTLEEEVAQVIASIHLPTDWRAVSKTSIEDFLQIDQRRKEMQESIERLDFRWDMVFIAKAEYLAMRKELQKHVEQEQIEAETIFHQFKTDWVASELGRRKQLLHTVMESAQVRNGVINAIKLQPRFTYLAQYAKDVKINADGFIAIQVAKYTEHGHKLRFFKYCFSLNSARNRCISRARKAQSMPSLYRFRKDVRRM